MAVRRKTLTYFTKLDADVADAVTTNLDQIAAADFLTEYAGGSRSFRSVLVYISFEDIITATGGTIAEHRVGVSVDGAGYTTVTKTDDIAHSGEQISGEIGPFDFTDHFNANYPASDGASLDIQVYFDQSTGSTLGMRNVSARIEVTYEFDDDGVTTQYETACIPIESHTDTLAATETEIGTNQIPQLSGSGGWFENVTGFAVKQQAFVVRGNFSPSSNSDRTISMKIGSGSTKTFGTHEGALSTQGLVNLVHLEKPATSSAHAFKLWTSATSCYLCVPAYMYVTYAYTPDAEDKAIQSIRLPFQFHLPMGGPADTDFTRLRVKFSIQEPGTIELLQSAVAVFYMDPTGLVDSPSLRIGGQSFRSYTHYGSSVVAGPHSFQQRFDSGGAQGAGITLARGENILTLDLYTPDSTQRGGGALYGYVILNYRSDVATGGRNTHNRTVRVLVRGWDADAGTAQRVSVTPTPPGIPESAYFVNGVGYDVIYWTNEVNFRDAVEAAPASGESVEGGYVQLGRMISMETSTERACIPAVIDATREFRRYPTDPDVSRMDLETSRAIRFTAVTAGQAREFGADCFYTYHSIAHAIAGDVSGSAGGTVNIDAYRKTGNGQAEKIGSTSRSGNGAYSIPWYDDTVLVFARGYEDSTHKAVSVEDEGGSTFDLDLAAPGGSAGILVHPGMGGGMSG